MGRRKNILYTGGFFHICSRSIAEFKIFSDRKDFLRMKEILIYYLSEKPVSYSDFLTLNSKIKEKINTTEFPRYAEIIAYCIMPTHIHLVLHQLVDNGISKYMEKVLKSYSLYFNKKIKRKGPLWSGRFLNIHIENDEQLLHLTRYIHLNPVTAYLVEEPEEWEFSSYNEYVGNSTEKICYWNKYLNISPSSYKIFVKERKGYQRQLQKIKQLLLEETL